MLHLTDIFISSVFHSFQAWFSRIKRSVPARASETDTIEELRHKIWGHASVDRALSEEKPAMTALCARGRRLLQAVTCPALEADITSLNDQWVQLASNTGTEIKR